MTSRSLLESLLCRLVLLGILLSAASCGEPLKSYEFVVVKSGRTTHITDDGRRTVVPFVTNPYLTLNFGATDPYVAVGLDTTRVVLNQKHQIPSAMFADGYELVVHIDGTDYDSKKSGSTGYLLVSALGLQSSPEAITLDAELAAVLTDGTNAVSITGTIRYRK